VEVLANITVVQLSSVKSSGVHSTQGD